MPRPPYRFGRKSRERLKGVDSRLVNVLNELVKIMDVTIIEGLRSADRQAELLEKGATKVKGWTKLTSPITGGLTGRYIYDKSKSKK